MDHALRLQWKSLLSSLPNPRATEETERLVAKTVGWINSNAPTPPASSSSLVSKTSPSPLRFLYHPPTSMMIWSCLARHEVNWEKSLQLLSLQLSALQKRPSQRAYIEKAYQLNKSKLYQAVVASWSFDTEDINGNVEKALMSTTSVVAFGKLVRSALSSRPHFHGVLPVRMKTVKHLYSFVAPQNFRAMISLPTSQQQREAKLVLEVSNSIAVSDEAFLTLREKETLSVLLALVFAMSGQSDKALLHVEASKNVIRRSIREEFSYWIEVQLAASKTISCLKFGDVSSVSKLSSCDFLSAIRRAALWEEGQHMCMVAIQQEGKNALATASTAARKTQEVALYPSTPASSDMPFTFLSTLLERQDVPSPLPFECLAAFTQPLPPAAQTYAFINMVVKHLPRHHPRFVIDVSRAMKPAVKRMYSGAFTRRYHTFMKRKEWERALALICSAEAYDLALPLVPHVERSTLLPPELYAFEETLKAVQRSTQETRGSVLLPKGAKASSPVLLAFALYSSWEKISLVLGLPSVMDSLHCQQVDAFSPRLVALLHARRLQYLERANGGRPSEGNDKDAAENVDGVFTYSTAEATQLVMRFANEKQKTYFLQVIPSSLRAFHVESGQGADSAAVAKLIVHERGKDRESDVLYLSSLRESEMLCQWLLRPPRGPVGAPHPISRCECREHRILRTLAQLCACGRVQAPGDYEVAPTSDSHPSFLAFWAFVKAVKKVKGTLLDASMVTRLVSTHPSIFTRHSIFLHASIFSTVLESYALVKNWQVGLSLWKEAEAFRRVGDCISPTSPDVLDAALKLAYVAPRSTAVAHSEEIWRAHRYSPALTLLDLLEKKDTRELIDQLRHLVKTRGAKKANSHSSREREPPQHSESSVKRRELIGMGFSTLHDVSTLTAVVQAARAHPRITSRDVDSFGLQRLVSVLPPSTIIADLEQWSAAQHYTVQAHWLWWILPNASISQSDRRKLCAVRPYAYCTSSICTAAASISSILEQKANKERSSEAVLGSISQCLRSMLSLVHEGFQCDHDEWLRPLFLLIRQCCEARVFFLPHYIRENELTLPLKEKQKLKEMADLSRSLFNSLLEHEKLGAALRRNRAVIIDFLARPKNQNLPTALLWLSPLIISGYIHTHLCHILQRPLLASISSQLLVSCTAIVSAAPPHLTHAVAKTLLSPSVFFFGALRSPNDRERRCLLEAAALVPLSEGALLQESRFIAGHPAFVPLLIQHSLREEETLALLLSQLEEIKPEGEGKYDESCGSTPLGKRDEIPLKMLKNIIDVWDSEETCQEAKRYLNRAGYKPFTPGTVPSCPKRDVAVAQELFQCVDERLRTLKKENSGMR